MIDSILSSPFFREAVLPFLLIFTLIYAILDKTKILGDGKSQVNAIVALVVGLMFIGFTEAVVITVQLMGIMAVLVVIMLVFILLFAFASGDNFQMPKTLKTIFGILIGLALIISLLVITGYWNYVITFFEGGTENKIAANLLFFAIVGAAIAVVLGMKGKGKD